MTHPLSGIEQTLLKSLFFLYAGGLVAYLAYVASGITAIRKAATLIAAAAAAVSFADLVVRGIVGHRIPTANLAEFSLITLLALVVIFLVVDWRASRQGTDLALVGGLVMGICLALIMYLYYGLKVGTETAEPMMPILKSYWRTIHVISAGPGYGGVMLAFVFGLLYLLRRRYSDSLSSALAKRIPSAEALDRLCYLTIAFSFPFLTLLNVTGAIWAAVSWNRYWSWDPKEVWSLVTWLVYAVYLHARLRMEWRGAKIAWVAVIGFGIMLFTLLGVNYLPQFGSSLHSYAGGG